LSAYQFCPREIERLVDQGLHLGNELFGVQQTGMDLKGRLIRPAGMNVEEPRVGGRSKGMNTDAPRFGASGPYDIPECLFRGDPVSLADMEASKEEKLQVIDPDAHELNRHVPPESDTPPLM
jgi:hypothetical protein